MTLPTNTEIDDLMLEMRKKFNSINSFNLPFERLIKTREGYEIGKQFIAVCQEEKISDVWLLYLSKKNSSDNIDSYSLEQFIKDYVRQRT